MHKEPPAQRDYRSTQVLWLACKLAVILAILNGLLLSIKATGSLSLFLNGLILAGGLLSYARIVMTTERGAGKPTGRDRTSAVGCSFLTLF